VDDERKVGGRSFQTRGPETAKRRDPYVIVLVLGTIRSPRAAERRQRRPVLAATGTQLTQECMTELMHAASLAMCLSALTYLLVVMRYVT